MRKNYSDRNEGSLGRAYLSPRAQKLYGAVELGAVRATGNAQFARRKPDKEFRRRRDDGALTLGAFAYRARFAHGARADDIAVADLRHLFAQIGRAHV